MLFSHEAELEDLKRPTADTEMRVIPLSREDFKWLTNSRFITFLKASFGIRRSSEGFLRVSKNQSPEDMQKAVVLLTEALDSLEQACVGEDGILHEDHLANFSLLPDEEEPEKKPKKKKKRDQ